MAAQNLPAIVTTVGGALEKVVSDIEAYTEPNFPLTQGHQMQLARLIEDMPELNTEPRVALLVDALAFHGVNQSEDFKGLLRDNDAEDVYLALDFLYEVGVRTRGTTKAPSTSASKRVKDEAAAERARNSMNRVHDVIDFIQRLRTVDIEVNSVEVLEEQVYLLGGLEVALDATTETIEEANERES